MNTTTVLSNLKPTEDNPNFPPSSPLPHDLQAYLQHTLAGMLVTKAIHRHPLDQADIEELRAAGAAEVQAILAAMYRELADAESKVNELAILNDADLSGRLRTAINRYHDSSGGVA